MRFFFSFTVQMCRKFPYTKTSRGSIPAILNLSGLGNDRCRLSILSLAYFSSTISYLSVFSLGVFFIFQSCCNVWSPGSAGAFSLTLPFFGLFGNFSYKWREQYIESVAVWKLRFFRLLFKPCRLFGINPLFGVYGFDSWFIWDLPW